MRKKSRERPHAEQRVRPGPADDHDSAAPDRSSETELSPWPESFFCRTGPTLSTGSDVEFVRVLPSKFAAGISVGDEEIQRRERRWIRFTIYSGPFRTTTPKVYGLHSARPSRAPTPTSDLTIPTRRCDFREIIRANEILCDPEQRAAYDHLLSLAYVEQEQDLKQQAVFTRIYRLASGVMAFAGVSIMTVGGYLLFMHMSAASVAPSDDVDTAMDASPAIVAVGAAARGGRHDRQGRLNSPGKKPFGMKQPGAPNVAMVRTNAESAAPAMSTGPDPDATEAKALRARGMSAYHHGDLHSAIADLDQALQRDPGSCRPISTAAPFSIAYEKSAALSPTSRRRNGAKKQIARTTPAAAGKPGPDQVAITGSVTPSSQRQRPRKSRRRKQPTRRSGCAQGV